MLGSSVKRGAFCLTQRLYSFLFNSLRSKSSRLVSEQRSRKTEERDFRFGLPEKWKRGEGEGKEGNLPYISSPPLPALLLAPFFTRFLTLVPRSLHRNPRETLATQAIFLRVLS